MYDWNIEDENYKAQTIFLVATGIPTNQANPEKHVGTIQLWTCSAHNLWPFLVNVTQLIDVAYVGICYPWGTSCYIALIWLSVCTLLRTGMYCGNPRPGPDSTKEDTSHRPGYICINKETALIPVTPIHFRVLAHSQINIFLAATLNLRKQANPKGLCVSTCRRLYAGKQASTQSLTNNIQSLIAGRFTAWWWRTTYINSMKYTMHWACAQQTT